MAGVIPASEPSWIGPFTGLSPRLFRKLVTVLRREGADANRRGRPWSLPLEDRALLVATYWRTNLITADAGGSNGYRTRAWKLHLARLAAETGLVITVCHLPPGTSKWNKIEHRLFSHITMNWRGRPLTSHEVILESIAATRTGLRVKAELDTHTNPTGIGVGDAEMAALPLTRHTFHGEWNYALHPQPTPAVPAARSSRPPTPPWSPALLSDPELTGLAPHQLQHLIDDRPCTWCGRLLPRDTRFFSRDALGFQGLRARCRECCAAIERERYARTSADVLERKRQARIERAEMFFRDSPQWNAA